MQAICDTLLHQAREAGARGIRGGARLMTLLENNPHLHLSFVQKTGVLQGPGTILGITGAPGSGKSTLTDAFLLEYRKRFPDRRIGVIAVDPSSPFSGGAILGDRVRMMQHAIDPSIFIRSLATRGQLGGLALGVKNVLSVMAWMGMDLVLIETVGVGQSELDIVRIADEVAVVLAPGNGDSMQLLKAGLMEIGDFIVINKADRAGAAELYHDVLTALQLAPGSEREVVLVSAMERTGISELIDIVEGKAALHSSERARSRRELHVNNVHQFLKAIAHARMEKVMKEDAEIQGALSEMTSGTNGDWPSLVGRILGSAARQEGSHV